MSVHEEKTRHLWSSFVNRSIQGSNPGRTKNIAFGFQNKVSFRTILRNELGEKIDVLRDENLDKQLLLLVKRKSIHAIAYRDLLYHNYYDKLVSAKIRLNGQQTTIRIHTKKSQGVGYGYSVRCRLR